MPTQTPKKPRAKRQRPIPSIPEAVAVVAYVAGATANVRLTAELQRAFPQHRDLIVRACLAGVSA